MSESTEIVTPKSELVEATQEDFDLTDKVEDALMKGDLSGLEISERKEYYDAVCKSLGLNPLTQPFGYIEFNRNGSRQLQLYAKKDCAQQLRKIHKISITDLKEKRLGDRLYRVKAQAEDKHGRIDQASGVVPMKGNDSNMANKMMKAETKAKRRVTLSICGLGFVDESEIEDTSELDHSVVEEQTSNIADQASQKANGTNGSAESDQEDSSDGDEEPDAEPEREEQSEEPAETDEEESESSGDDVQKIELMADEFKKETLKHECRERDLKVSGDKFELADRLVSNGVDPQNVTGFYDDETEYADREDDDPGQEDAKDTSDDSDAESSGGPEVKMFEIMQKTKDLLDQIENGNFTHVNFTVDQYGQSEDVVSEIVSYLEKCVNGEAEYETDEDDLLPIDV